MPRAFTVIFAAGGQPMQVTERVADALRDLGRLHGNRSDLDREAVLVFVSEHFELGICDFCSAGTVSWEFPCADHVMVSGTRSSGPWRACEVCAVLIRQGRRAELETRCGRDMAAGVMAARAVQSTFWTYREGPGTRLGDG